MSYDIDLDDKRLHRIQRPTVAQQIVDYFVDWVAEWCLLLDAICGVLSFNFFIPQLEFKFLCWWERKH